MQNVQSVIQVQTTMPQTIMSRELLQMPALMLRDYLSESIIDNPLLEIRDFLTEGCLSERTMPLNKREANVTNNNPNQPLLLREEICGEVRESLRENLKFQASLIDLDRRNRKCLSYLIECINEDGYFQEDISEIGRELHLSDDAVLQLLKIIQGFYPTGVGARNLQECLILQIDSNSAYAPIVREVIKEDLLKVAHHNFTALQRKYHLSVVQLQRVIDEIQKLNPKPGLCFCTSTATQYVYPEARILIDGAALRLEINQRPEDLVTFNRDYMRDIDDAEVQSYLKQKKVEAMNLINGLYMRQTILRQLLLYLIKEQRDFFFGGKDHLRPLSMKEAADALGVHPSTITRCVKDKYIETPWGLVPLKQFFQNSSGNEELSREYVYQLIRKLVSDECKTNPFSDEEISVRLREKRVFISRRTVSKYREQLHIPSQRKRRKY